MCCIENHTITSLAHPVERAHVCDKGIVAKCCPPLGKAKLRVAKSDEFLSDVAHVPRRQKLTFFDVDRATGFCGGTQQIRLPAEEGRDLQHVDVFAGNLRLSRGMYVGCHRNLQFAPDVRENIATFAHADSTKRADRS